MSATFKLGSIANIKVAIAKFPQNKDKFVADALNEFQEILLKEINKKAPKDKGEYAKSWKKGKVSGGKAQVETPKGELFQILEFQGRKPGRIEAKIADVLAFEWKGKQVFFKFVDHPGFKEMPHVRPSMRAIIKDGNRVVFKALKKNVPMLR